MKTGLKLFADILVLHESPSRCMTDLLEFCRFSYRGVFLFSFCLNL